MLTTGKIFHNGKEAIPAGTGVNLRQDKNGRYIWGTIDTPPVTAFNLGDTCELILKDGSSFQIRIESYGRKSSGDLLTRFEVNGPTPTN
jgi:hypothetical protein